MTTLETHDVYVFGDTVYLGSSTPECLINFFEKNNYEKLVIRSDAKIENLDFLYKLPFLRVLSIPEMKNSIDLNPIYALKVLETLDWSDRKNKLKISKLPCLENLAFTYSNNICLENSNSVKKVFIRALDDFTKIPRIDSVVELRVLGYKKRDLENIDKSFPSLKELTLVGANKLENVNYLDILKLSFLEFEKVNKNCDFSNLKNCKTIEALYLRNKIMNCDFIECMDNLSIFSCKEVMDGNLEPIYNSSLENVNIDKFSKNSSFTRKDFKEKFGEW